MLGIYLLLLVSFVCRNILRGVIKNHLSWLKQPWAGSLMIRCGRFLVIRGLILVNDVQKTRGSLRLNIFSGWCRCNDPFLEHISHRCTVIFRHYSGLMMLFQMIQRTMIVLPSRHYLCQVKQFEILRLKVELWPHQIIPVPFVGLRELHLIYLVLDH